MNTSQIATAIALRDLQCSSLETIDDRILLHKKIYIAHGIGLPLGYGYTWNIHGLYSIVKITIKARCRETTLSIEPFFHIQTYGAERAILLLLTIGRQMIY